MFDQGDWSGHQTEFVMINRHQLLHHANRRPTVSSERREALAAALEARGIVRDRRNRIAATSPWFVIQTDWEEQLAAEREN
jgi:hypothetical protein